MQGGHFYRRETSHLVIIAVLGVPPFALNYFLSKHDFTFINAQKKEFEGTRLTQFVDNSIIATRLSKFWSLATEPTTGYFQPVLAKPRSDPQIRLSGHFYSMRLWLNSPM